MPRRKNGSDGENVAALTLEVLRGLRSDLNEGLAGLRAEIKQTNARLDETVDRLDRLERRQNASEIRLASELVAVTHAVSDLETLLETRLGGPRPRRRSRASAARARAKAQRCVVGERPGVRDRDRSFRPKHTCVKKIFQFVNFTNRTVFLVRIASRN